MSEAIPHVFICFSSKDEIVAREVVAQLEQEGVRCWISLRDVAPGQNYQESIVEAIETARSVVFLFSESSSKSLETRKELSIAASVNAPVFPLRLSAILPTGALRYELAIRQWIDLFPDRDEALRKLAATIKKTIATAAARPDPVVTAPPAEGDRKWTPSPLAANSQPRSVSHPGDPIVASGSAEFESIRALLARHIGPIAKVFVQKAATEARTADEFCERLAAHVAAPNERPGFMQAVRKQLAPKS